MSNLPNLKKHRAQSSTRLFPNVSKRIRKKASSRNYKEISDRRLTIIKGRRRKIISEERGRVPGPSPTSDRQLKQINRRDRRSLAGQSRPDRQRAWKAYKKGKPLSLADLWLLKNKPYSGARESARRLAQKKSHPA